MDANKSNLIMGRNPVIEALRSGRDIDKLMIGRDLEGSVKKIIGMAKERHIPITYADKQALD